MPTNEGDANAKRIKDCRSGGINASENGYGGIYIPIYMSINDAKGRFKKYGIELGINDTTEQGSELHTAIKGSNVKQFNTLLEKGANPYAEDKNGKDSIDKINELYRKAGDSYSKDKLKSMRITLQKALLNPKEPYLKPDSQNPITTVTEKNIKLIQKKLKKNKEFKNVMEALKKNDARNAERQGFPATARQSFAERLKKGAQNLNCTIGRT